MSSEQILVLADGAVDAFRERLWDVVQEVWEQATQNGKEAVLNERDATALFYILESRLTFAIGLRLTKHLAQYRMKLRAKEEEEET